MLRRRRSALGTLERVERGAQHRGGTPAIQPAARTCDVVGAGLEFTEAVAQRLSLLRARRGGHDRGVRSGRGGETLLGRRARELRLFDAVPRAAVRPREILATGRHGRRRGIRAPRVGVRCKLRSARVLVSVVAGAVLRLADIEIVSSGQPLTLLEERARTRVDSSQSRLRLSAPAIELITVLLESTRTEERAQQALALLTGGEQKPRELVLRQKDHLLELLRVQTEDLAESLADRARFRRAPDPSSLDQLLQLRPRRLRRQSAPALGGAVVFRRPRHAPASHADGELQSHLGRVGEIRVVAAQTLLPAVVAGHAAIQGEADPVENARFAGAGTPGDQEESVGIERVEVDDLRVTEGPEAGELQTVELHANASTTTRSSSTSRSTSRSRSVSPSPSRTCDRNASNSSRSLRAARTRSV
ncbi:hypothetical protein Mlaev_02474 [Microbacterium laevaniformans]|uniref:Uncharacterized protein n=1 Tax=Microbacterium laevaniformans TaxID=36807 RepID=A0A150H9Y6_9MICO|nr:hypothetical protein Mlaev_02474 [Microbacterium laevaniformans]